MLKFEVFIQFYPYEKEPEYCGIYICVSYMRCSPDKIKTWHACRIVIHPDFQGNRISMHLNRLMGNHTHQGGD